MSVGVSVTVAAVVRHPLPMDAVLSVVVGAVASIWTFTVPEPTLPARSVCDATAV